MLPEKHKRNVMAAVYRHKYSGQFFSYGAAHYVAASGTQPFVHWSVSTGKPAVSDHIFLGTLSG